MPSYLQQRRRRFYAVMEIPKALRQQFGKPRFVQSLGTDSLMTAQRLVHPIVGTWKEQLHLATMGQEITAPAGRAAFSFDPGEYRRLLHQARTPEERREILDAVDRAAAELASLHDFDDAGPAGQFYAEATAIETTAYLDEWLATLRTLPKTRAVARGDVMRLAAKFPTLDKIDRASVRKWIAHLVNSEGLAPRTVQFRASNWRTYWRFIETAGHVEDGRGPFDRLEIRQPQGHGATGEKRRPFAPSDVTRLLAASQAAGDGTLADLITLAMWTGCRIEELCSLKVADVDLTAGAITIGKAKTEAGVRVVPIHSALRPMLERLNTGQYVLSGLAANKYGKRSNAIGKRFSLLKTAHGYGPEVVFHSIRKTVATLLENAGVSEGVAADILGHEKKTMTYGLYSGGASLAVKQAAIEKLIYPTP